MNPKPDNELLSDSYIDIIKGKLHKLDDSILSEDVDILCKYIVIRFLKTSPEIAVVTKEDVLKRMEEFISEIWPFVLTFVSVVNSSPLHPSKSELFGGSAEDSEA